MDDIRPPIAASPKRFLDCSRETIRRRGLSYSTEKTYLHWVKRYIRFHRLLHPAKMGSLEVTRFLNDLAERCRCSVATQRTALNALVFLYRHHLDTDLGGHGFRFARRGARIPTVFTHDEAIAVISKLQGDYRLAAGLMYGAGLRLNEALRLRLKDLDFGAMQITVRYGKRKCDRCS